MARLAPPFPPLVVQLGWLVPWSSLWATGSLLILGDRRNPASRLDGREWWWLDPCPSRRHLAGLGAMWADSYDGGRGKHSNEPPRFPPPNVSLPSLGSPRVQPLLHRSAPRTATSPQRHAHKTSSLHAELLSCHFLPHCSHPSPHAGTLSMHAHLSRSNGKMQAFPTVLPAPPPSQPSVQRITQFSLEAGGKSLNT